MGPFGQEPAGSLQCPIFCFCWVRAIRATISLPYRDKEQQGLISLLILLLYFCILSSMFIVEYQTSIYYLFYVFLGISSRFRGIVEQILINLNII